MKRAKSRSRLLLRPRVTAAPQVKHGRDEGGKPSQAAAASVAWREPEIENGVVLNGTLRQQERDCFPAAAVGKARLLFPAGGLLGRLCCGALPATSVATWPLFALRSLTLVFVCVLPGISRSHDEMPRWRCRDAGSRSRN